MAKKRASENPKAGEGATEEPRAATSATGSPAAGDPVVDEWAPAPPPLTPSWDALEAQVEALQTAIEHEDWPRSSEIGATLSEQLRHNRDDPFLAASGLTSASPEAAPDSPFASLEKGLPEIPHFDEFGRCAATERRFRPLLSMLAERYFRLRVEGLENIPGEGRLLLVANHAGVLPYDALLLLHIFASRVDRLLRPLVENRFFHAPVLGPWLYRMGCVRGNRDNARRLLAQEQAIVVFPEGHKGLNKPYSQRYRLQRFGRGGFVKLALQTGAPIVPVSIVGGEEVHPLLGQLSRWTKPLGIPFFPITPTFPLLGPLGALPLPSRWQIRFGAPITLPGAAGNQIDDPLFVNRIVEEVRTQMQCSVTQMVSERRWF